MQKLMLDEVVDYWSRSPWWR